MKKSLLAAAVLCALVADAARAQDKPARPAASAPTPGTPPPLLARPETARIYAFGLLRKGPKWTPGETPEIRALQEKHLANIARLAKEGKLVAAGPCGDGDLRGVFVFATESLDEARALADTDPAVQAGRLRVELHTFLGAPGIGRNAPAERARAGGKVEMVSYQLALARLGPRFKAEEASENRALFMARNQWLQKLEGSGRLALSGPFTDGGDVKGLLVLKADSLDAARKLLDGDPAAITQRFAYDVQPWWLAKGTLE